MESAALNKWLVNTGDSVLAGQVLAQIETDKINHEIESPASGTIRRLLAEEGSELVVGTAIAEIDAPG